MFDLLYTPVMFIARWLAYSPMASFWVAVFNMIAVYFVIGSAVAFWIGKL
jgi:hypothetical protein